MIVPVAQVWARPRGIEPGPVPREVVGPGLTRFWRCGRRKYLAEQMTSLPLTRGAGGRHATQGDVDPTSAPHRTRTERDGAPRNSNASAVQFGQEQLPRRC